MDIRRGERALSGYGGGSVGIGELDGSDEGGGEASSERR